MPSENTGRLDHIAAMRAVAVLHVIWTHYAERFVALAGVKLELVAVRVAAERSGNTTSPGCT